MSVQLTHDVWIPGTVTTAVYGTVQAYQPADGGVGLDELLDEIERQAEALGATHVISLAVDAVLDHEGQRWLAVGCAVALSAGWWSSPALRNEVP